MGLNQFKKQKRGIETKGTYTKLYNNFKTQILKRIIAHNVNTAAGRTATM
jgi:hypothetical protein